MLLELYIVRHITGISEGWLRVVKHLRFCPAVVYRCAQDLFERPNFEFVRHDVTEPFKAEVDQIYNMACPASPVHYQYNPIKTTKVRLSP